MTVTIRPLTSADANAIVPILTQAFGEADFAAELQLCLKMAPEGWLLAEQVGRAIGMVGAIVYGSMAQIGLMAVDPACQRQGIGQLLFQQILTHLEQQGCSLIQLEASPAGARLYAKFGFVQTGSVWTCHYRSSSPPSSSPDLPPNSRIRPWQECDLPELIAFDSPIFGADRQVVLQTLGQDWGDRAFVARDQAGQVTGYLFAQPDGIGPWVAIDSEVAKELLKMALQLSFVYPPYVWVPDENPAALDILITCGFQASAMPTHLHMIRGQATSTGQRQHVYALAHLSLG